MDLQFFLIEEVPLEVSDSEQLVLTAWRIFSVASDVISTVAFIFLLIYNVRRKAEVSKDVHSPIFNQLLYISAFVLCCRHTSRILWWFSSYDERRLESPVVAVLTYLFALLNVLIILLTDYFVCVVLMITFLAAIQRLVILYKPDIRVLFIGKQLRIEITFIWVLSFIYFWLTSWVCTDVLKTMLSLSAVYDFKGANNTWYLSCSNVGITAIVLFYRALFIIFMLSTLCIYYHFYKLVSKLTPQDLFHKIHLLYQFVPIHLTLTMHILIYSMSHLIYSYFPEYEVLSDMSASSSYVVFPLIPLVIFMSYIASRDNIRSLIVAVMSPLWDEFTSRIF